ncbi:polyhydroxyalkanoate synthesis regulator phasin [Kitasatospora sp. MAA19]|uniref:hypothetical protein n=1 Tax=Kitasatospora sp. MAA19 TaxID=3035090 RepID=UPI0024757EB0|nr:hypothetical protein [Kitasatospora sp. MAA19]MDH6709799.1 polyhydroxyalkanoate synthesis regulator phasin [Kitasatospora sp. MAA19]
MADVTNPVARRAAILIANTTGTPEEIATALDAAGMLQRPAERINGAYPLWVRPTALGVAIDAHPLVSALVRGLAAEVAEDGDEVVAELVTIAEASGPERDAMVEQLLERLGGTDARYAARDARHMAEVLLQAVGPVLPQQQDRRAA